MKLRLHSAMLVLTLLASCTAIHTQSPEGGSATFASLGGDSRNVTITPQGAQMGENINSVAFKDAARGATIMTGILSVADVSRTALKETGATDRLGITELGQTKRLGVTEAGTTQRLVSDNATKVKLAEIEASTVPVVPAE